MKGLTWVIIILTALTMLVSILFWTSGSIPTLIYTGLVMIQSIKILKKLKKEQ